MPNGDAQDRNKKTKVEQRLTEKDQRAELRPYNRERERESGYVRQFELVYMKISCRSAEVAVGVWDHNQRLTRCEQGGHDLVSKILRKYWPNDKNSL